MSDYYKIPRGADWNYGGRKWKLSRSKIELFMSCKRCFYLDNKMGLKRPPGFPFNLNSAVDSLLKQEFDWYRSIGQQHPLQAEYGLDAIPAQHENMDTWRENFEGVQTIHKETGMVISGAIDDLWVNNNGEYHVVDYKATAKSEPVVAIDEPWQTGYKRQMEIYQWLLRRNGLKISNVGYFVYCTGRPDEKAFDKKIEFDVNLIPYTGDDSWVEGVLFEIRGVLGEQIIPEASPDCDYCKYRKVLSGVEK